MTDATTQSRRPRRRIAVIVVAIVLLVAAVVAAEFIARSVVTGTVRSLVVENVGLPDDQDVDVQVGGGLVLPQVLGGRLSEVTVASDDVTLGPITGDVLVDLRGVPVSGGAAAEGGTASVRLDQDQLRELLAQIPDLPASTVTIAAPDVMLQASLSLFGIAIPVGVGVTPGASDGDLTLAPSTFSVGGNAVDADTLRQQFGGVADAVLQTSSLCIADRLPAGLTLASATVQGEDLVATFDIAGGIVNDPVLQTDGSCG